MNKFILGLVILLLGLGAGWYMIKGGYPTGGIPNQNSLPSAKPTSVVKDEKAGVRLSDIANSVVTYTDTGFSPITVTVKKGTTVTFVNSSRGDMWVASAVHPTHQLLPGFDELKSVPKNGTYEYTFVKVGTWKYHNHMNPADKGTVVVTE